MSRSLTSNSSATFSANGRLYKDAYDRLCGNTTPGARVVNLFSNITLLALVILASLAVANVIPGVVVAYSAVGMGCGYLAIKLIAGNWENRKIDLISSACIAAVMVVFGALGAYRVLTEMQMGCALIGEVLLVAMVCGGAMIFAKRREVSHQRSSGLNLK